MYVCFVCQHISKNSLNLQSHISRHRKSDIISSVIAHSPTKPDLGVNETESISSDCKSEHDKPIIEVSEAKDVDDKYSRKILKKRLQSGSQQNSSLCSMCSASNENYYIPSNDPVRTPREVEEAEKFRHRNPVNKRRSKRLNTSKSTNQPVLRTPKIEKQPSSETDSCPGSHSQLIGQLYFCSYCNNGYSNEEQLVKHEHIQHVNYCAMCDLNFSNLSAFKEHNLEQHMIKVYLCPYCNKESSSKEYLSAHMNEHLEASVVDNVLSLEKDYFSEKTYFQSMYNLFNAGFIYAKKTPDNLDLGAKFYEVFLKFASFDVQKYENCTHFCPVCGNNLYDSSLYKEHAQYVHQLNICD